MDENKEKNVDRVTYIHSNFSQEKQGFNGIHREQSTEMWRKVTDNTTLHGMRYVFMKRHIVVRLMWIVTMLIAGGYYVFVVYNAFHKYYSRPINTVISTTRASKMNFPAITICPLNVFAKSKIFMTDDNPLFASNGLNLTLCPLTSKVRVSLPCGVSVLCCCTPREFLHFIQSRLPDCTSQYRQDLLEALQQSPNDHDIELFHRNYAQDIKVLVGPLCTFGWQKLPCSSNDFVSMVTPWGICYTFNSGTDVKVKTVDRRIQGVDS